MPKNLPVLLGLLGGVPRSREISLGGNRCPSWNAGQAPPGSASGKTMHMVGGGGLQGGLPGGSGPQLRPLVCTPWRGGWGISGRWSIVSKLYGLLGGWEAAGTVPTPHGVRLSGAFGRERASAWTSGTALVTRRSPQAACLLAVTYRCLFAGQDAPHGLGLTAPPFFPFPQLAKVPATSASLTGIKSEL